MNHVLFKQLIRIIFHKDGNERTFAKKILDNVDRIDPLHSLFKKCLFSGSGIRRIFFAPRYAQKSKEIQEDCFSAVLPRLTAVTMVRNEHVRMHDSIRHLCALFDRVVVIDHCSDDDTSRIALGYQGVSDAEVLVLRGEDPGKYQAEYMTACANALIREAAADWIFLLMSTSFFPSTMRRTLSGY